MVQYFGKVYYSCIDFISSTLLPNAPTCLMVSKILTMPAPAQSTQNFQTINNRLCSYKKYYPASSCNRLHYNRRCQQEIMKVTRLQDNEFDPRHPISKYLIPDWEQASRHGLASRIGTPKETDLRFCECCFHQIDKQEIPLCRDTKQLEFLGFGVPLYFAFVRNCIFLLLLMLCCYNVPSLYYALQENAIFCQANLDKATIAPHSEANSTAPHYSHMRVAHAGEGAAEVTQKHIEHKIQCTGWMIHLSRIKDRVGADEQLIRAGSFFVHLIMLIYMRDKLTKMKYYFDERTVSPSDFAVFAKNIPPRINQKREILDMVSREYGLKSVMDIILVPDMAEYQQLEKEKNQNISKLESKAKKQQPHEHQIQRILDLQQKMTNIITATKKLYAADKLEAQRAILLFNSEAEKWQLIKNYEKKKIQNSQWSRMKISEASEPNEIIWENACVNSSSKNTYKALGWSLSVLTLLVTTGVFALISHGKSKIVQSKIKQFQLKKGSEQALFNQAFCLVLGMMFLVVLFNKFVLAHLFHKFTQMQRHSSSYKFQFYFCLKYCLGLFFTTALMTIIIEDLIFHNYFEHNFGVIEEETIMFLFNALFVPLFWLINPMLVYRKIARSSHYGTKFITQQGANHLMEDPSYDVGKRYGQVLQIMWFTFLYMAIIPVGAVFSCLGLIAYYWVDKYNLLRRSSIHGRVSGDLISLTLSMLDVTLVLRVLGEIKFDYQLRDSTPLQTWVLLGIAVVYILAPGEVLINFFNYQEFMYERLRYNQAELYFKHTYYDSHVLFSYLPEDRQTIIQDKIRKKQQRNQTKLEAANKEKHLFKKRDTIYNM